MEIKNSHDRAVLQEIAHQAMLENGMLPEYSRAALAELSQIHGPAQETDPSIRDLRSLLWASIDNDDSLDLDQLSVAVPSNNNVVKILVSVADVDALVKKGQRLISRPSTIRPQCIPRLKSSPCYLRSFQQTSLP
jgi:exoribonuclease-2